MATVVNSDIYAGSVPGGLLPGSLHAGIEGAGGFVGVHQVAQADTGLVLATAKKTLKISDTDWLVLTWWRCTNIS